ncbi:Phosphoserine aminotransferase [Kiritimatiella glycovorans]|uniref:Phosphoserine aminotransferase n=2 Tax=Kiritimatiella glycovorans TaxID=1307763 RepID=A0A0G3EC77_9BACT|nr:3-phosphoserine/phosphohydroxythreonine transaminase [Kiritimatiella glycovorans]AKJ64111.1 Phosphoserine aminotransferase [Kiritimatiella glycovorans]
MARVYNFSPGPATLPEEVLKEAQTQLADYKGSGMSILESSHRGKEYSAVHEEARSNIAELLNLTEDYAVLFMSGGASTQFALAPMNLMGEGGRADYVDSGSWSTKAIKEARKIGEVHLAADVKDASPARMPKPEELTLDPGAAYLHLTSNETIAGTQWKTFPDTGEVPIVADMSSDICSRTFDVNPFGLIYAGAQKNLGPAGVTIVVIRRDLAERAAGHLPTLFQYRTFVEKDSLANTPPVFPIYIVSLVTRWLLDKGGIAGIEQQNRDKAAKLYAAIDGSDFYRGTAAADSRSDMNVTFRLAEEELEKTFIEEAARQGMKGLKGHRSVGGVRASIYNAFPVEGVDALVDFMKEFEKKNG